MSQVKQINKMIGDIQNLMSGENFTTAGDKLWQLKSDLNENCGHFYNEIDKIVEHAAKNCNQSHHMEIHHNLNEVIKLVDELKERVNNLKTHEK